MNPIEVAEVLGVMNAAWPLTPISDQTAMVWAEMLEGVHVEDGVTTARTLIKASTRFPSIAEFLSTSRPLTAARRQNEMRADFNAKAITAGPEGRRPSAEEVRKLVADTNAVLDRKGIDHNHLSYPCPLPLCPWNKNPDAPRWAEENSRTRGRKPA